MSEAQIVGFVMHRLILVSVAPVKCAYGTTTHRTVSTTSDPDPHLPSTPSLETSGAYALTGMFLWVFINFGTDEMLQKNKTNKLGTLVESKILKALIFGLQ